MDCWWQLGRYAAAWGIRPDRSPVVLVGVHGRPGAQIIVGATRIAVARWSRARRDDAGLLHVPTAGPANLDAFGLRGRRIAAETGLRFGPFMSEFYAILTRAGRMQAGGRRSFR